MAAGGGGRGEWWRFGGGQVSWEAGIDSLGLRERKGPSVLFSFFYLRGLFIIQNPRGEDQGHVNHPTAPK
jgi:hypothetical protein